MPRDFRTIRDQGGLKSGILQHVFLFVTPECRDSYPEAYYPWLWAIDTDWPLDGSDQDGYDGRVPINWGVCYQKFYNFVSIHQYSLKEIWLDYHEVCKKWPEKRIPGWGLTLLDQPKWPDY